MTQKSRKSSPTTAKSPNCPRAPTTTAALFTTGDGGAATAVNGKFFSDHFPLPSTPISSKSPDLSNPQPGFAIGPLRRPEIKLELLGSSSSPPIATGVVQPPSTTQPIPLASDFPVLQPSSTDLSQPSTLTSQPKLPPPTFGTLTVAPLHDSPLPPHKTNHNTQELTISPHSLTTATPTSEFGGPAATVAVRDPPLPSIQASDLSTRFPIHGSRHLTPEEGRTAISPPAAPMVIPLMAPRQSPMSLREAAPSTIGGKQPPPRGLKEQPRHRGLKEQAHSLGPSAGLKEKPISLHGLKEQPSPPSSAAIGGVIGV